MGYLDVLDPSLVRLHWVTRESNDLCVPLLELWHKLGHHAQLSGADGSVVCRVGEQNSPAVQDREYKQISIQSLTSTCSTTRDRTWAAVADQVSHTLAKVPREFDLASLTRPLGTRGRRSGQRCCPQ